MGENVGSYCKRASVGVTAWLEVWWENKKKCSSFVFVPAKSNAGLEYDEKVKKWYMETWRSLEENEIRRDCLIYA